MQSMQAVQLHPPVPRRQEGGVVWNWQTRREPMQNRGRENVKFTQEGDPGQRIELRALVLKARVLFCLTAGVGGCVHMNFLFGG